MTELVRGLVLLLSLGAASVAAPVTSAEGQGKRQIYPEAADAKSNIAAALQQAKREHKRVIVDFGGDWCGDCQVLDIYFHQGANRDLLEKNFVLVHVFVKETFDNHLDIAARYGIPLGKGVPALAILDAGGNVLYAQKTGQFADMRHMDPGSVNAFLSRWKG